MFVKSSGQIDPELYKLITGSEMDLNYGDVDRRMSHYAPTNDLTIQSHELARELAKAHAKALMDLLPAGREKSLVLTALEEALMWSNAAIARHRGPAPHVTITTVEEIRTDFSVRYGTGSATIL